MNAEARDTWFFTYEGERSGPVTFEELQAMARDGDLNPRVDMVWGVGMDGWRLAGEVDGLFQKRRTVEEAPVLNSIADPYTPPTLHADTERMLREEAWPGARRRGYLTAILIFPLVWKLGFGVIANVIKNYIDAEIMGIVVMAASFVPPVVIIYYGLMRLVNLGMSKWWYLGNLVPILNLWVGYRCFACPAGYAFHRKLDGVGVVLAVFYWLMIVVSIIAILALVALFFGVIDSPALREQLSEALRVLREQAARR